MKTVFILIIGSCIFIVGCSKSEMKPGEHLPELEFSEIADPTIPGGDDDDFPIVMVMLRDINDMPVEGAQLMYIKGADTLSDVTNQHGVCIQKLTQYGKWQLKISHHAGYQPVDTFVDVEFKESVLLMTLIR